MSRTLTAIAIIAGALLTYLMGAAVHWSLDPGDWEQEMRGIFVLPIWPMASVVVAVLLHTSRED